MSPLLPVAWVSFGIAILVCGVLAAHHPAARRVGRYAVGGLYLAAGALVNAAFVVTGEDYDDFATGAYVPFVRDTWASLVVPHARWFIGALVVFEAVVGVLTLLGGRWTQLGLGLAIAFHVALLSFGWGFYAWSIPMIAALALLLRAERRDDIPEPRPVPSAGALAT
jgi:hypothetical protein